MKPAGWMQMLEQLQESLNQTSKEVDRQEAVLASSVSGQDAEAGKHEEWQRYFDDTSARLRECQAHIEQAGQQAEVAESQLVEQEERLRQFHAQLEEFRQKLANVPAVAIE